MLVAHDSFGAHPLVTLEDGHAFGSTYLQRARARRRRRAKATRRKMRNFRRQWRKFWRENWSQIARFVNQIGAALLDCIPIVGPLISSVMQVAVEAAIVAGEIVQAKIKAGKLLGEAAFEGFKAYMQDTPEGLAGIVYRINTKYWLPGPLTAPALGIAQLYPEDNLMDLQGDPVVTAQRNAFNTLMALPAAQQVLALEEQSDMLPPDSPQTDQIDDQIEQLEDTILPEAVAIEQALDERYWQVFAPLKDADPKGGGRLTKPANWSKYIQARITSQGDFWVKWTGDIASAPEGTLGDVWYSLMDSPAMDVVDAKLIKGGAPVGSGAVPPKPVARVACNDPANAHLPAGRCNGSYEYDWRTGKMEWKPKFDRAASIRWFMKAAILDGLKREGVTPPPQLVAAVSAGLQSTSQQRLATPPNLTCTATVVTSPLNQLKSTLSSLAASLKLGLPSLPADGKYDEATERTLKAVLRAKGIPDSIDQTTIKSRFTALGYGEFQADRWAKMITYIKRQWREDAAGERGQPGLERAKTQWRGEGSWPGYACEVYHPEQFTQSVVRYQTELSKLPEKDQAEARAQWTGTLPMLAKLPVRTAVAPTLAAKKTVAPTAPVLVGKTPTPAVRRGLPTWAWALIGVGGAAALGGGALLVRRVVQKRREAA